MNNAKKLISLIQKIYNLLPPVANKIAEEKRRKLKARISPCF
ncbi:hypothetical protein [Francisella philomiragia]|nr:hypothetical protein [Francisella philomiragia]